jgi:cystathionine beta-synthase
VVILPDSGDRYLSKIFNDDWMRENGFLESAWTELHVSDVLAAKASQELYIAHPRDSQADVIASMKKHDVSQLPVVEDGRILGLVTEVELLDHWLTSDHPHQPTEPIKGLVRPQVAAVEPSTSLETLTSMFTTRRVVLVVEGEKLVGIITKIDLLDFLTDHVK